VDDVLGVFATLNGLTREGKVGRRGLPKNPRQFAATLRTLVKHEGFDASVPIPAQRFLGATLGWLSEALGYRAVYPGSWATPSHRTSSSEGRGMHGARVSARGPAPSARVSATAGT
jgi:hypothetical protein